MAGDIKQLMSIANDREGLVTITEIEACGFSRTWASSRVQSDAWRRIQRGIYGTFPTEPTWDQRARAALLLAGREAALSNRSAGYLHRLIREAPDTIEVLVPHKQIVVAGDRVTINRTRRSFARVGNPRRTTLLDTVLDLVDTASSADEVLDVLTAGIRQGLDPATVLTTAAKRRYLGNRSVLRDLLQQGVEGVESTLEHQFHTNVVLAHGLPTPTRQDRRRIRDHWIRSDCWYEDFGLRVELDGELAHPGRATDRDIIRDNDVILALEELTLRYRWPHTLAGACVSAAQLAVGLRRGGFEGAPTPCREGCAAPTAFAQLLAQAATRGVATRRAV